MANPSVRDLLRSPVLLLAFGFGSGLSPRAPGTAGTLLAALLYPLLALLPLSVYLVFVAAFTALGVWVCGRASASLGVHDHGGIVIDEMAGFWIAMIAVPTGLPWLLAGFLLFRFFDIVKPWPIRAIDRRVEGGFGIMLDDVVAGVFTWAVLMAAQVIVGG